MAQKDELLEQLMEVQSQLAFQEDTINSLNEALAAQQQEIITLRRQVTLLKQRQDEQAVQLEEAGSGAPPADERPPHY